jgi:hypothetical protein
MLKRFLDWLDDWRDIKEMAAEYGLKRRLFETRFIFKNRILDKAMGR